MYMCFCKQKVIRYAMLTPPIVNLGSGVVQSLMTTASGSDLPLIRGNGLLFNNLQQYLTLGGPQTTVKIDLQTVLHQHKKYNAKGASQLPDVWTLTVCFCHPAPSVLYFSFSIEIEIQSRFTMDVHNNYVFSEEWLIIRLFDSSTEKQQRNQPITIRSKIRNNFRSWSYNIGTQQKQWGQMEFDNNTYCLILTKLEGNYGSVRCILNGKEVLIEEGDESEPGSTNLLSTAPSKFLFLGHKCKSGDKGIPIKLFNGHLFELSLYPFVFREFEIRSYWSQCKAHLQKYLNEPEISDMFTHALL
ncbi:hypothetical protein RFI_07883 [Reticulomyxa filosa]|uniref:Uncharacterized protein n=1 Tax=Reticulomyxa filosa TaxID=46433 RepID=X6NTG0_RETFI|nr:hypothetical protein RFI_07883 [Reticulomyxa filosa]|eukprot:ETO29238.1 hypothetical protein RFI_07883 [Reticulomyxa filosa]